MFSGPRPSGRTPRSVAGERGRFLGPRPAARPVSFAERGESVGLDVSVGLDELLTYTILYYTILYYTILYYTILYYIILYYTILYYTILYYTILCVCVCACVNEHYFYASLGHTTLEQKLLSRP